MKARIIRIGNSRGIRLPKALLEQAQLGEEVQLDAEPNQIVIRSAYRPRQGWDEAFRQMRARNDDRLPDEPVSLTSFDETEWEW